METDEKDFFMTALKVEQFGLLTNAVVRFDHTTESYSFEHQSLSYANPEWRIEHFEDAPKRSGVGEIEFNLTHEYLSIGNVIISVTPFTDGRKIVIANANSDGRRVIVYLRDLQGNPCDSDFSLIAIMPIGH